MFKRKFEFTVYHPLEVCEERILDIKTSGCLMQLFQPISCEVIPVKHNSLTEFYLKKILGNFAGQAELRGVIEVTGKNQCTISGSSQVRGMGNLLVGFTLIGISIFIEGLYDQNGWSIGLAFVWTSLAWLQFIYYRNQLISKLETALTQPKKKKV
jgi:hypothetical protein